MQVNAIESTSQQYSASAHIVVLGYIGTGYSMFIGPGWTLLGGSSQDGRKWLITIDTESPIPRTTWDPFQLAELHGLKTGCELGVGVTLQVVSSHTESFVVILEHGSRWCSFIKKWYHRTSSV